MARRIRPLRFLRRLATVVLLSIGVLVLLARLARHSALLSGAVSCGLLLGLFWVLRIGEAL